MNTATASSRRKSTLKAGAAPHGYRLAGSQSGSSSWRRSVGCNSSSGGLVVGRRRCQRGVLVQRRQLLGQPGDHQSGKTNTGMLCYQGVSNWFVITVPAGNTLLDVVGRLSGASRRTVQLDIKVFFQTNSTTLTQVQDLPAHGPARRRRRRDPGASRRPSSRPSPGTTTSRPRTPTTRPSIRPTRTRSRSATRPIPTRTSRTTRRRCRQAGRRQARLARLPGRPRRLQHHRRRAPATCSRSASSTRPRRRRRSATW